MLVSFYRPYNDLIIYVISIFAGVENCGKLLPQGAERRGKAWKGVEGGTKKATARSDLTAATSLCNEFWVWLQFYGKTYFPV